MEESKEVRQIPIEDIIPNRFQPRINFEEKALNDLSNSIRQHGIIQPLVVRPLGDKFEIIAGERRYKAATMAGLNTVPAIVTDMDDNTSAEVALVENVQRKDLTPIEEARSYKNMLERGNMTQEELAKKMGLSQSTIANKLRLLNLSEDVQNALMSEKISERHARALLSVSDKAEQSKWLDRIINERLTVRQLDLAIKDELAEKNNEKQEQTIDNDIPIVNINPDIESIISNTSDINAVEDKPKVDVFEGLNPINENNTSDTVETEEKINVNEKINENHAPNKFFNFLEDEEVNMGIEEKPAENQSNELVGPNEVFSFSPEFNNQNNNETDNLIDQNEDKFAEFDQLVNNSVQNAEVNEGKNVESIEILGDEPVVNVSEVVSPVEEQQIESLDISPDNNINENIGQNSENIQSEISSETSVADAIESVTSDNNYIEESNVPEQDLPVNEVQVEPIPLVEDDSVIDPVKLFDTLEPDFYEKVKETIGLDLKTAINDYRDLTNELIKRGFNIEIEELDETDKYKIIISIEE